MKQVMNHKMKVDELHHIGMQVGTGISTQDATTPTANTSPSIIAPGGTLTLKVPDNAAELVVNCDDALYVSEDSTFTRYDRILAGSKEPIGCARGGVLYLKNPGSAEAEVYWRWNLL
jgi:hypothetical protein